MIKVIIIQGIIFSFLFFVTFPVLISLTVWETIILTLEEKFYYSYILLHFHFVRNYFVRLTLIETNGLFAGLWRVFLITECRNAGYICS